MRDLQGLLYKIRETSTDHLERKPGEWERQTGETEETKRGEELEQITIFADAALELLRFEAGGI